MKILIVAQLYSSGIKKRGYSYEYFALYDSLKNSYQNVDFFDFLSSFLGKGKEKMNQELLDYVKREKPDVTIFSLYRDEFIPEIVEELKKYTITLCCFWDDQWRINFSKFWAPLFSYVITPDFNGIRKYREIGYNKAIYSPLGYNHFLYKRKNLAKKYDVSFVGLFHPYRNWFIKKIRKSGLKVDVFGAGWKSGHIPQEEVINIFNQSKINLNLSNCLSWELPYLLSSVKAIKNTFGSLVKKDAKEIEQIKGRHFEVTGSGGFQMSYYVEGLEHCFEIGKEIVVFSGIKDLVEKIKYYLKHEEEREKIAQTGYQRTIGEHTYKKRFEKIFKRIFYK